MDSRGWIGLIWLAIGIDLLLHSVVSKPGNMLGSRQLAMARPGLIVINTARGPVIDEAALVAALRSGQVAGAGLDVFRAEPPHHSPLLQLPNVVVSPHIAGLSRDSMRLMLDQCIDKVLEFLKGPVTPRR